MRGGDGMAAARAPVATAAGDRDERSAAATFAGRPVVSKLSVSKSGHLHSTSSVAASKPTVYKPDVRSDGTAVSGGGAAVAAAAASASLGGSKGHAGPSSAAYAGVNASPSSGAAKSTKGGKAEPINTVDVLGRRVWDKSYYEARAQSKEEDDDYLSFLPAPRQKKVAPPVEHRRPLQRRDFSIDLTKELGRSKIVTLQTPRMQQGGFWCDVCECLIKDSAAYLDHVNGRNHNRMLGMTMRVERAPPERVIGKLRELERQAQLELEGEDSLDGTAGGIVTSGGGAAGEGGTAGASSLHVKSEGASAGSAGASAAAGKVKRPLFEENYDDIDRIKRRLEELQKQDEEKKLRRKLKKKRKKAGSGPADEEDRGYKQEAAQSGAKEEEQEETEEQKLLKAMGLPCGFVGT